MAEAQRKNWLDAARGLAMLFVMFGHVGNELMAKGVRADSIYMGISAFVNPVKVPLFFAISGYLFSMKNGDISAFAKKMLKGRILPYIVWGSFMGIIAFGVDFLKTGMDISQIGALLVENYIHPFLRGNLIWFIPCLTVTEIIYFVINKLSGKNKLSVAFISAFCVCLGYYFSSDGVVKLWKIDTALTCVQFMCFGNMLKYFHKKYDCKRNMLNFSVSMVMYIFLLVLFSSLWNGCRVDVNMGSYFNKPAFTLLSFTGIYAFFALSKFAERLRSLLFVGRNTFVYFVWHMYAVKVIIFIMQWLLPKRMPQTVLSAVITAIACVLVACVCVPINRYLPTTVGKKK